MKTIIQAHNNKILSKHKDMESTDNTVPKHVHTQENADDTTPKEANAQVKNACNCRTKTDCPLKNQCKSGPLVYRATIKTSAQETHTYIGCSNDFKERWANHKQSFKNISRKNETVLSHHVWSKGLAPKPDITFTCRAFVVVTLYH